MTNADAPQDAAAAREWDEWVSTRPPEIQTLARRYPPWRLYRLRTTDQRVRLYSYSEDGTVTVFVLQEDNPHLLLIFDRKVFGINPDDLEAEAS